jgi:hypothetical protein
MRLRRLLSLCFGALLLLLGTAASADAAGPPDPGGEGRFVALLNGARANAGLPPLAVSGDLVAAARQHAAAMADRGALYHSGAGSRVGGWTVISENVGRGSSVDHVHGMFMGSGSHRANIVDGRVSQVGVGVVWSGSTLYVTQIFRQPRGAAPPPPPPAPRPRVVAPAPSPPPPPPTTTTAPPTTTTTAPPTTTTTAPPTTTTTVLRPAQTSETAPGGPPFELAALGSAAAGGSVAGLRLLRRWFLR